MKKILMGVLTLSMTSFATKPDISLNPTTGTNVFNKEQEGKIQIEVRLRSTVATPKYVVYSSNNGTWDETAGDIQHLFYLKLFLIIFLRELIHMSIIKRVIGVNIADLSSEELNLNFKLIHIILNYNPL